MKKHNTIINADNSASIKKYYILSRPSKKSELPLDELDGETGSASWIEKSRQLQARRWRKIRHQTA